MYISLICLYCWCFILTPNDASTTLVRVLAITGLVSIILAGLIAFIICVISFISIFRKSSNDYTKFVMVYKIIAIPWFIGNFILCVLLIGGMLNPFLLFAIPLVIVILVLSTYICMLSSSMINIGFLVTSWKNGVLKPNPILVISLILEFNFCLDLIGAALIAIENKKQLKSL